MDDLVEVLTKFHREIVVPDIERIVGNAIEGSERRIRDEMHAGFDALMQRLDRLETEYHMLVVGALLTNWGKARAGVPLDMIPGLE